MDGLVFGSGLTCSDCRGNTAHSNLRVNDTLGIEIPERLTLKMRGTEKMSTPNPRFCQEFEDSTKLNR